MKKSYNTKKPLSMLPLLALALFNTSMYSMKVVQPEAPQIVVFITYVENKTNKDLTITIDKKDYTIKAGGKRNLRQQVKIVMYPVDDRFTIFREYIPIKHKDKKLVKHKDKKLVTVSIDGGIYPAKKGYINFLLFGKELIDQYDFLSIKPGKSYDFDIQLTLEGENLEESKIKVVAVEK